MFTVARMPTVVNQLVYQSSSQLPAEWPQAKAAKTVTIHTFQATLSSSPLQPINSLHIHPFRQCSQLSSSAPIFGAEAAISLTIDELFNGEQGNIW
jgi:hypothetical protein